MSYCPSQDWDRLCRNSDPPEVCPVCGGENSTEEGEPVCVEAPDFCGVACRDAYVKEQREADDAEARYLAELDALQPDIDAALADGQERGTKGLDK